MAFTAVRYGLFILWLLTQMMKGVHHCVTLFRSYLHFSLVVFLGLIRNTEVGLFGNAEGVYCRNLTTKTQK